MCVVIAGAVGLINHAYIILCVKPFEIILSEVIKEIFWEKVTENSVLTL